MRGQTGLVPLMIAGFIGCGAPKPPLEEPQKKTPDAAVVIVALPAPSPATNSIVDAPPVATTDSLPRERRCRQSERREQPTGALAWISDCFIKIAQQVHFQVNSDEIRPESEILLQAVANILHDDGTLRIQIGAHSDARGSSRYNKELTQKRADAVKNNLVGKGIDAERLIAMGFGEERPISHPPEVEGRRTNRRIEFVILPE